MNITSHLKMFAIPANSGELGHNPQDETQTKEEETDHINIKVCGQDQNDIAFKIKRSTALKKLMKAYVARTGAQLELLRFLYEGHRILPTDTPDTLKMEDGDIIQTAIEQIGGTFYGKLSMMRFNDRLPTIMLKKAAKK